MGHESIERRYQEQGLETVHMIDEPGKVYESHGHERTTLYTLAGWVAIKHGDSPIQILQTDEEFVVGSGVIHEATVGFDGWEYVAAFDPEEAKLYPDPEPLEDDEDRLIREGEVAFAKMTPEEREKIQRIGDDFFDEMQSPENQAAVDRAFRRGGR